MRWERLLFMHWPLEPATLARALPAGLEPDTFDGSAWLGVVPFVMAGVRLRAGPSLPWLSRFCELNVRTYVTVDGKPGVYFFSLDCERAPAVGMARRLWSLPYLHARMCARGDGHGGTHYFSTRTDRRGPYATFGAHYRPVGDAAMSTPGTIEAFLTERYCLYTVDAQGNVHRGEIHHRPWSLQPARCNIGSLDMTRLPGVALPELPPLLHYAEELDVVAWLPMPCQN